MFHMHYTTVYQLTKIGGFMKRNLLGTAKEVKINSKFTTYIITLNKVNTKSKYT